jgi:hypothetical protein
MASGLDSHWEAIAGWSPQSTCWAMGSRSASVAKWRKVESLKRSNSCCESIAEGISGLACANVPGPGTAT